MDFRFCVLGSGSAGNCAVVQAGGASLLIDAGLSAKQIRLRLEAAGLEPDELDGILLTHEHGDHTRGLEVFMRKVDVPVYCNIRTREVLRNIGSVRDWRLFESGDRFEIGPFEVNSFYVPHDAVEPVGYDLRHGEDRLGVLSDVGHVTNLIREQLRGVNALFVEANYDDVMLQNDTKRPWSTKQRIASRHGHLSNAQTRELVCEVADERLRLVVLGHLSQDCNAPDMAVSTVREGLESIALTEVDVACAAPDERTPFFTVSRIEAGGSVPPVRVAEPAVAAREMPSELGAAWDAAEQSLF